MGGSWITLMLYLPLKEFAKGKLKKFGKDCIQVSLMTLTCQELCQRLPMKNFQRLRNVRNMIWFQQLKGRVLSFIR